MRVLVGLVLLLCCTSPSLAKKREHPRSRGCRSGHSCDVDPRTREQGPNGDDGPPGRKGHPGLPGLDGRPGVSGYPSEAGDAGRMGTPGIQGPAGPPGYILGPGAVPPEEGIPGLPGENGHAGRKGAYGIPGRKGDRGDTGTTGPPGNPGHRDADNFDDPYFYRGFSGMPGLDGLPGLPGRKGQTGECNCQGPEKPKAVVFSGVARAVVRPRIDYELMTFDLLTINLGNGIRSTATEFSAPIAGVYTFHAVSIGNGNSATPLVLFHNASAVMTSGRGDSDALGVYPMGANNVILELDSGDVVSLQAKPRPGGLLSGVIGILASPSDVTFSGFLLRRSTGTIGIGPMSTTSGTTLGLGSATSFGPGHAIIP